MAIGPGKYDDLATAAREAAEAEGVILIVVEGIRGSGFAVQLEGADLVQRLPKILRHLADEIEVNGPTA